jgi:cytochrome c
MTMQNSATFLASGVGFLLLLVATPSIAGLAMPDGATLFSQQCSTCHTTSAADPPRQGPNLAHVYGRRAGVVPGFSYSPGFASAGFTWDATHLDAYLTNPQSVIPGAVMAYRQRKPEIRQAIITWLKAQS